MPDMPPRKFPYLVYRYIWNTYGENCPICDSLRGRVYTMDTWMSVGIVPGFHWKCNCSLKRVADDYPLSDPDFFGMDINLYMEDIYGWYPPFFSWNPGYVPLNIQLTNQVLEAYAKYGSGYSLVELLKKYRQSRSGYFPSKYLIDEWLDLRQFRYVNKLEGIDQTWKGFFSFSDVPSNILYILEPFLEYYKTSGDYKKTYLYHKYNTLHVKPESLTPLYPKHTYHSTNMF